MTMTNKRVLVGISGGIDSTATVLMLQEAGYIVDALYIDMLGCEVTRGSVGELCAKLGVELHIADAVASFNDIVVNSVIEHHNRGETPSPCTICNPQIKWRLLEHYADRISIQYIATGHYIQIKEQDGWHYIAKGIDPQKDQSYYLYDLNQAILSRAITPLGLHTKSTIREYLERRGYDDVCQKPESQGVCFAKSGYREFLTTHTSPTQGDVRSESGEIIGSHNGYQLYTIGQKRGFTHSSEGNPEVRKIIAHNNEIVIGQPLLTRKIVLRDAWFHPIDSATAIHAKIRGLGRNTTQNAMVSLLADHKLQISIEHPEFWAPTAGQPSVLYQGDIVVGGGVICV